MHRYLIGCRSRVFQHGARALHMFLCFSTLKIGNRYVFRYFHLNETILETLMDHVHLITLSILHHWWIWASISMMLLVLLGCRHDVVLPLLLWCRWIIIFIHIFFTGLDVMICGNAGGIRWGVSLLASLFRFVLQLIINGEENILFGLKAFSLVIWAIWLDLVNLVGGWLLFIFWVLEMIEWHFLPLVMGV